MRLKQIGLAFFLVASLLVGSASACACSHHQEKDKSTENACHGTHQESENVKTSVTSDAVDVNCVCFVDRPTPIASKTEGKQLKASKRVSNPGQVLPDPEFVAATTVYLSLPGFARDLSYSNVLKSLLPSRAPPRL